MEKGDKVFGDIKSNTDDKLKLIKDLFMTKFAKVLPAADRASGTLRRQFIVFDGTDQIYDSASAGLRLTASTARPD